jgi:hypothetical protein
MTLFLTYGNDSTGKSVQHISIAEMSNDTLYVSLEVKNRRLLKGAAFDVVEALVIEKAPSFKIDPIASYNRLGLIIENILNGKGLDGKPKQYDTVIIDGISDMHRWAEKVVIAEMQKKWDASSKKEGSRPKVIGKENLSAWSIRNNLAHMPLERLSTWAEMTDAKVFLTSLMADEYVGEKKVGRCVDAKDRLRKLCDVRVLLTNDNRGYIASFEKVPAWAGEGQSPVKIGKSGLASEFAKRALL